MKSSLDNQKINFIYWFAYYNLESPSVRYRANYPLKEFKKKYSVKYFLVIPGYSLLHILKFLRAYLSALLFRKKNSLIVIQRVNSSFIYASLLKRLVRFQNRNTVYDLDDADYLEYEVNSLYDFTIKCDKCVAGSDLIKTHLQRLNPATFKITSPTVNLGITKKKKNKILHIGWVGGFSWGNRKSMTNLIFPAIKALKFKLKLTLIGVTERNDFNSIKEYFSHNKNIELNLKQDIDWNNEKELQLQIVKFDIGVATLKNEAHQKSKSGIKVKQCLSLGIPVLCNNLPENNIIIKSGSNGYFCQDASEFQTRLIEFFEMSNTKYEAFSNAALATSEEFNHNYYWEKWNKLYFE